LKKKSFYLIVFGLLSLVFACGGKLNEETTFLYANKDYWAYYAENDLCGIDVFFVAPTVFAGDSSNLNMPLEDSLNSANFLGAINMEKGIYDESVNFYAPYYRQVGLFCYVARGFREHIDNERIQHAFDLAYDDVELAFDYYLNQSNRPFILAGFSQGSEILIRLIKNKIVSPDLKSRFIAAYAIGWRLSEKEVQEYPQLKNAKTADDIGVVITYSSESESIDSSIIVPSKTLSINPLSWTTNTTYAPATLNKGACFTDYYGNINKEIKNLTGAFIDPERGSLKVPDVDPDEYPPVLPVFKKGEYHIYDYMFFYRNLQENVKNRTEKYFNAKNSFPESKEQQTN
jgi:hypothetical protein